MVRFIINKTLMYRPVYDNIYIPIWLDLLLIKNTVKEKNKRNLHSNMVRFIINFPTSIVVMCSSFTFQYG